MQLAVFLLDTLSLSITSIVTMRRTAAAADLDIYETMGYIVADG